MNRPLRQKWTNPYTGIVHSVSNYLSKEEAKRIRKDKSVMYVQTAFGRYPVFYVQDLAGTYGKAKVYIADNTLYLRSYDTIVCSIYKSYKQGAYTWHITRYWNDWSRTTANHVNAFLQAFGGEYTYLDKKHWLMLPLYQPMTYSTKED